MKIKRIRFHGFGHWIDKELTFYDGINLIEAPNESGKSTLIQGIFALLYGRNKEGNYKTKQKAVWFEQYIPWQEKNIYGGEIDYIIDEELYRLVRSFHDDDQQLVRRKTGEDITENFSMDQKKERLFLENQLGLSGELLKYICFIHSLSFSESMALKDSRESELTHKFTTLVRQGDELDIYPALKYLNKQINKIGTKQNLSNTPYGNTQRKMNELKHMISQLRQVREQMEIDEQQLNEWIQKEVRICKELQQLQMDKKRLQLQKEWEYLQLQKNIWKEKLNRLTELRIEKENLVLKVGKVQIPSSMPQEGFEGYVQCLQNRDHLEQQYKEIGSQIIDLKKQINYFKEENDSMIKLDVSQAQQMIGYLDQYRELEANADRFCDQISEQRDQYIQAEKDIKELKRLAYSPSCSQKLPRFWLWISLVSTIVSFAFIMLKPFLSAILALIGMSSLFVCFYLKRRYTLQLEKKQHGILKHWGVQSVFELYRRQEEIASDLKQMDKKHEHTMEQIRQRVKIWMLPYQQSTIPFDPPQWKEQLNSFIQKSKEKKKWLQNRESRLEYLCEEKERIHSMLMEAKERIEKEKITWGTDHILELNRLKHHLEIKQNVYLQVEKTQTELNKLIKIERLEGWQKKFGETCKKIDELVSRAQGWVCQVESKQIPLQKLQMVIEKMENEYLAIKHKIANLRGSLGVRYKQLEKLSDLEVECKQLKAQLTQLDKEKRILQLAIDTIEEARKKVEEDITPQLKPYFSKWIAKITKGRYLDCSILPDKGFSLRFIEPTTGKSIPVSFLSRGTIDQMYFGLRLAMLQFYSQQTNGSNLPLFLDDSFVQFDDFRLRSVMKVLFHFSKNHQIFLCTCQDRERRVLEEEQIPFQHVPLCNLVLTK